MPRPTKNSLVVKLLFSLAVLYTAVLLWLSLGDISDLPQLEISNADKLYHGIAYFGLVSLWFLYFFTKAKSFQIKTLLILSGCALVFGMFIELMQLTLTTNRSFDYWDMTANFCGIAFAFLLLIMSRGKLEKLK